MSGKIKMVSFRLTEKEYKEISGRIPKDDSGKPIMKISTFIRGAISDKKLIAVDRELEQYKVHAAAKIGNNINQLAKRLNKDNLNGLITPATYDGVLNNLEEIKIKLKEFLAPLR